MDAMEESNLIATPFSNSPVTPAGFWLRFFAFMIDALILVAILVPLTLPLTILEGLVSTMDLGTFQSLFMTLVVVLARLIVSSIVTVLYIGFFYQKKQATLGKIMIGLKVIRLDSLPLGYKDAFVRDVIGKYLSSFLFMIGYLMVAFRTDKRAMHDLLAKTQVIQVK
jgi:uncharacterized RDD family membrane protein YckC